MSAAPRIFYLRSAAFKDKKRRYLCYVSDDACTVEFSPDPRKSYSFTDFQRSEFVAKHPHIKGRWVLMRNELLRTDTPLTAKQLGGV